MLRCLKAQINIYRQYCACNTTYEAMLRVPFNYFSHQTKELGEKRLLVPIAGCNFYETIFSLVCRVYREWCEKQKSAQWCSYADRNALLLRVVR